MGAADHDLLVIGAGPGGYAAALRAAQLGWNVGCVEQESALGGTCLRVGCIPSKALLESSHWLVAARQEMAAHGIRATADLDLAQMMRRKEEVVRKLTGGIDHLFRKQGITRHTGVARLLENGQVRVEHAGEARIVSARHILVATGSRPAELPGVAWEEGRIGHSTEGLSFSAVPERLIVIGAGYIGLELGSVWNRLGAQVTILEGLDRVLPGLDAETAAEAQRIFTRQGLRFRLGVRVESARAEGSVCRVQLQGGEQLEADRVLVAVGRVPNTRGLGLEAAGVGTDERGRIRVQPDYSTGAPGISAIGDVIGGPMLAHKATEEGVACVERWITGYGRVHYDSIPSVVYTSPEIGTAGQTEEQLKASGVPYRKGVFPFRASGRALTLGSAEGRVKVLSHAETDRLLGVHIIGPSAGELINAAAAALAFSASAEDLARVTHAHPTLGEALREAAMAAYDKPLHL